MSEVANLQINGPVVVLPLDEFLEIKTQLEEYRRLKTIYDKDRDARFQRLFSIAKRNQDIPVEQIEADVAAAVDAVRSSE
jgi:hypothetical protein